CQIQISKRLVVSCDDNNLAEYAALLLLLKYALQVDGKEAKVYCDSEVVVKQIRGEYKCQSRTLQKINQACLFLRGFFTSFEIVHIRDTENIQAHNLAQRAI